MSYFYFLSILLLWVELVLIKKSETKLNFITSNALIFLVLLSYQTFCAYILNLLNITVDLTKLVGINTLIILALFLKGIKGRNIQTYLCPKKDMFAIFLFLSITVITSYANFGKLDKIKYVSTDARVHYMATSEFAKTGKLVDRLDNKVTGKQFMPLAYTNEGILFQALRPFYQYHSFVQGI